MKYCLLLLFVFAIACEQHTANHPMQSYNEPYRPQIHFSPKQHWMNDPNGMVYWNNTWHLFFQYYPDSTVWGPMHWAHATSKDLTHWTEQPIALFPDSLGYIFSGSVVVDKQNSSGFGKDGKTPLVAIFTQHDPKGEKEGKDNFQNQSIAYSVDEGNTWIKYANNPVLKNPGIKDFRDPKVAWNETHKKWIMTLATKDRVSFYSSINLIQWNKESEFGQNIGAHGGVWECPDLFPIVADGKNIWVLLVSINPGGPQGGSATQYFTGDFDGKIFTTSQTETKWVDAGTDDYAGVTWSNAGARHIFLGWMSNWQYAQVVPTKTWRSAMTLPRDLTLEKINGQYYLRSLPVKELAAIEEKRVPEKNVITFNKKITGPTQLRFHSNQAENFSITLSNSKNEKWIAGYDKKNNQYFIDRVLSGKIDFEKGFAGRSIAKRISTNLGMDFLLLIDNASAELFADNGLTVMTSIFFPSENYNMLNITGENGFVMDKLFFTPLQSIWHP
ncbi:MAG: glycoside hydrolase family 32 protein [Sediminibacterium sp.]